MHTAANLISTVSVCCPNETHAQQIACHSIALAQETELREPDPAVVLSGVQFAIAAHNDQCLVALDDKDCCIATLLAVGYELTESTNERWRFVTTFRVSPDYRGLGIGQRLMGRAFSDARVAGFAGLRLFCHFTNFKSLLWYLRQGFRLIPVFVLEKRC